MKGKYIALIVAGALLVGGVVVGVAAASSYAFNMNNMFSKEDTKLQLEERIVEISDSFKNIKVSDAQIRFVPSGDGKTSVDVFETSKHTFDVDVTGDTLNIKGNDKGGWMDMVFNFGEGPHVIVNLAESDYENIFVDNGSGSIKVE